MFVRRAGSPAFLGASIALVPSLAILAILTFVCLSFAARSFLRDVVHVHQRDTRSCPERQRRRSYSIPTLPTFPKRRTSAVTPSCSGHGDDFERLSTPCFEVSDGLRYERWLCVTLIPATTCQMPSKRRTSIPVEGHEA
ncbi:hypothetical protein B0J18DRAFT_97819 [Chaetomium sp. MPI-SDFR-AT-0129]|nr:hypothetical protein B0J18DRAFT_97819 [Chaetomium sp. MPI-SDFR-AT-0129]